MKNIVVLSSGEGTNLGNIIEKIQSKRLFNCKLSCVVSNYDSLSLKRAYNIKVPNIYYPWDKENQSREDYDLSLSKLVKQFNPDLIVLSGWNHILTSSFLNTFPHINVINLHPALLNTFPGNNAIEDAWNARSRGEIDHTGIMAHTVTTELDVGFIISSLDVPFDSTVKLDELKQLMKTKEKEVLITAIEKLTSNLLYRGKVKDVYNMENNQLLIVHTDRLSACDKYVCDISNKGYYLCKIASWWLNATKHIVNNHHIETNSSSILVQKCEVIPLEFIVRGYICGSLWKHYKKGNRTYSGIEFEDGLSQFQKLTNNILTPTTKGIVDVPISYDEILQQNILSKNDLDSIYNICEKLYEYGSKICDNMNLILVDTKYEFGRNSSGEIILVDEIHTVESSRFWIKDTYSKCIGNNMDPEKLDKDIIRYYIQNNLSIPDDKKNSYLEVYKNFNTKLNSSSSENIDSKLYNEVEVSHKNLDLLSIHTKYINKNTNIIIISGSEKDHKHVDKLKTTLANNNLNCKSYVCSAHKDTKGVLKIIEDNKENCKIYITVAGKSNALSGVVASNSNVPVISCPPFKDNVDMMTNLQSSIQCPSFCPVMTILDPINVSESCKRILF